MNLSRINALVTGAAGGIGSVVTEQLVDCGAHVLLTDRRSDALERLAGNLRQRGARVEWIAADITAQSGRTALARSCTALGVNTLVNVAGVNPFGMLAEQDARDVELAVAINTVAPMLLCQRLLPIFAALPQAHIVNVGSMLGSIAMPGYAAYCATKSAMHAFSEALRRELSDTNVHMHYVAPRATRTALNDQSVCEMNAKLGIRMDEPRVVARAVVHAIARDEAESYIGFPERFYRVVNALLPRIVDRAVRRQLPVIRRYASRRPATVAGAGDTPLPAVNN